ncbi:aminopeptidase [Aerococcus sp. UMB10185]|uniref:aminopeptidase n=1 Tax=unclassified Aerococcus TaxID=2618060 RepID=UPI0008A4147B|nr:MULTISPECIES: aminopeptidase [unclassified Aerococcus]MDK6233272.1 aminopeptidase [Aerococcus sp. UMB10185]MDK6855100.1 aminopeptidase [Aerococcus sp. UMB7533]OFN04438.1 peptidase M29 [Aerococcus sp. HMSC062A02]OHO42985.1 peptidase M29 [Aerococcus sp. HMSC035B07]
MENFNELLDKYAQLLIQKSIQVESQENVMIYIDIDQAPLARLLAKHAYEAGAKRVYFTWQDDSIKKMDYQYVASENLTTIEEYTIARDKDLIENKKISRLSVISSDPNLLDDIPDEKIHRVQKANSLAFKARREATMKNAIKWGVAAAASYGWARHVFPELADDPESCVDALWHEIFKACRVYEDDPVAAWDQHKDNLEKRAAYMNDQQFDGLHYLAPGTDLYLGLPKNHIWTSAESLSQDGKPFIANMPTEEIFTAPDTRRMSGYVRSTKPLSYANTTIKGIEVHFEDGQISQITADQGQKILEDLIENNDGARGLGEVALVPHRSPISLSNLTFYNTLFDENASNHLAIGAAYPTTVKNTEGMSDEELQAIGLNVSNVHVDFMIGSEAMDIYGIRANGEEVPIFKQGEWAFSV